MKIYDITLTTSLCNNNIINRILTINEAKEEKKPFHTIPKQFENFLE